MIIRKAKVIDAGKAIQQFVQDQELIDTFIYKWIWETKNTSSFYSIVAIENKKFVGILTALSGDDREEVYIKDFFSENNEISHALLNKLRHDLSPKIIGVETPNGQTFQELGFDVRWVNYLMIWQEPIKEESKEVVTSELAKQSS